MTEERERKMRELKGISNDALCRDVGGRQNQIKKKNHSEQHSSLDVGLMEEYGKDHRPIPWVQR